MGILTRNDCELLEHSGVLDGVRYELLDGVVVRKPPRDLRAARACRTILSRIAEIFGEQFVLPATGVHVRWDDDSKNAPEPDVLLLNKPNMEITTDQPRPEDIQLLIEVADTTRNYDLGTKAALYARAGVPEYWVISVDERRVYVHTNPTPDGSYTRREADETETVAPVNLPIGTSGIRVAELLPPAAIP